MMLMRHLHVVVLQYVVKLLLHARIALVLMRHVLALEGGGWRRPN
jgi:hypothetical protein